MPLNNSIKYSSDPEHRVKNKDGTVKRFPNERFPGDIVRKHTYSWGRWTGERKVEALIGPSRVKLEGISEPIYITSTVIVRKAY